MDIYAIDPYSGFLLSRKSKRTQATYATMLDPFRLFLEKRAIEAKKATPEILCEFGVWLQNDSDWEEGTKCLCSKILRSFYNHLIDLKQVETNPALILKKFKFRFAPFNPKPLPVEDCKKLVKSLKWGTYNEIRLSCAIIGGLYHALRISEVAGLEWSKINFKKNIFKFIGKGSKFAEVEMHSSFRLALRKLRIATEKIWGSLFPNEIKYVFRSEYKGDRPWDIWALQRMFQDHAQKAGIGKVTFHQLRHSMATLMVLSGSDVYSVRDEMRLSSIVIAQHYVGIDKKKRQENHEKAMRLLEN